MRLHDVRRPARRLRGGDDKDLARPPLVEPSVESVERERIREGTVAPRSGGAEMLSERRRGRRNRLINKARDGTAGHPQAGRDETLPGRSTGQQVGVRPEGAPPASSRASQTPALQPDQKAEDALSELAQHAERVLPEIARRLFTLDPAHPLADLPNAQLKVCSCFWTGRAPCRKSARSLNITVSAVTQLADRLEKAGLVERHGVDRAGPGDRRARYLALTAHGASLMESRRQRRVERVAAALAHVPATPSPDCGGTGDAPHRL